MDEDHSLPSSPSIYEVGANLALSGGGFRATLFHLGSLTRLNELCLLPKIKEISSVSGGSILAGFLAMEWPKLKFDENGYCHNFDVVIRDPIMEFCKRRIDIPGMLLGWFFHRGNVGMGLCALYDRYLFKKFKLRDIEQTGDGPTFTINSASLNTGARVGFTKKEIKTVNFKKTKTGDTHLAVAVTASSAFPPVFAPVVLQYHGGKWQAPSLFNRQRLHPDEEASNEQLPSQYDRKSLKPIKNFCLVDGGVYDNMGLDPVWKDYKVFLLVSDASGLFQYGDCPAGILCLLVRIAEIYNRQAFVAKRDLLLNRRLYRKYFPIGGTYWASFSKIENYKALQPMVATTTPFIRELAAVATRLTKFPERIREGLVNWGYAITDAALQAHVFTAGSPPSSFSRPRQYPYKQYPL